ncbi:MAG: S-adenosylmethionine decarboxylase, partial [Rhodocyclaceae bacterium]|nr:S-adenosylmethionine decarboxylase [Rhodocyclaceae bacterium]
LRPAAPGGARLGGAAGPEGGLTFAARLSPVCGRPQPPAGATGAVVLAESHLTVHTWPEMGGVTLDLYVCNFSRDNRQAAETVYRRLVEAFRPQHAVRRDVARGNLAVTPYPEAGIEVS